MIISQISDEINENAITLHSEGFKAIQLLLIRTLKEFDNTVMDSDEFLSPSESTAINDAMVTETTKLQQKKMKTSLEVQLLLSDVKNVINKIFAILSPVIELIYGHSGRYMKARDIAFEALDKTFKTNGSELEVSDYIMTSTYIAYTNKILFARNSKGNINILQGCRGVSPGDLLIAPAGIYETYKYSNCI